MGTCHTGIQSDGVPKYLRENLVATVDANRLAIRSQTETNNVAVPEPGDGEHDAKKRQQHAEDDKGFAARDRRDEPVEVHPEKASERGDGQEDKGHERQAIDLLALFAGDLGGEIVDDVRHPLPALEKLLLDVLHLVGVVVELRG